MIETHLKSFNLFSDSEIAEFMTLVKVKMLNKGDFFIKEGAYCKEVAFLKNGILRSFFTSDQNEDITYCITFPNTLMTAYSAFITGEPTKENIQALITSELFVVKKNDIDKLASSSQNWTKFLKHIAEQQYLELEKRWFLFQKEKAAKRYADLIDNQPDYIKQVPLQYLASYLGVTARHLSRIRKEILL